MNHALSTSLTAACLAAGLTLAACGPQPASDDPANPPAAAPAEGETPIKPLVTGTPGAETITGGDAGERISASPGDDILIGGGGADDFTLQMGFGRDWIADFQPEQGDRLVIPAGAQYTVTEHQGQLVMDFGNGDVLGFVGFAPSRYSTTWIVEG